jgi:lipid II:glycine glycyltransferase (peptidoglycan interpeptide bridge formation enzyme)
LLTNKELKVWLDFYHDSPDTTFFQSPDWAKIIHKTFPLWKPNLLFIEYNNELLLFPYFVRRYYPFLTFSESNPPGVYGGPLSKKSFSISSDLISKMNLRSNLFSVTFSPYHKQTKLITDYNLETSIVQLEKGIDPSKKFTKGHKSAARRGLKNDIEIKQSNHKEDIELYFEIYKKSLNRWGENASGYYPKSIFYNLFNSTSYGNEINLWLVLYEKKLIAGAWILKKGDKLNYWHGCFDQNFSHLKPVHALMLRLMCYYQNEDITYFDMGPSGGLKGVKQFKEGFNAKEYTVPRIRSNNTIHKGINFYLNKKERKFKKSKYQLSIP